MGAVRHPHPHQSPPLHSSPFAFVHVDTMVSRLMVCFLPSSSRRCVLLAAALLLLPAWLMLFYIYPLGSSSDVDDPLFNARKDTVSAEWQFAQSVDIVYTWVNGSDPHYRSLRLATGGLHAVDTSRDRDNNELLYSMRALETFMPWHKGLIHLVTPGMVPTWLNTSHPRIRIVHQDAIIPADASPAFSSNVVEAWLHRIPDLGERFIHMNDDYFFMRHIHPSDLFTRDGGSRLFFERYIIKGSEADYLKLKMANNNLWMASVYRTNSVLEKSYGKAARNFLKHAPFVYYRDAFVRMHEKWAADFADTSKHKFRDFSDVLTPFLHHYFVINEGRKCCGMSYYIVPRGEIDRDAVFLGVEDNLEQNSRGFRQVAKDRPKMLAINDGFSSQQAQQQIKDFLRENFGGLRSSFEIDDHNFS